MSKSLQRYGLTAGFEALFAALDRPEAELTRVIRQDRGHVVVTDGVEAKMVPIRAQRTGAVVAGDWVAVEAGVVSEVLQRASVLSRGVASRTDPDDVEQQPLVANVELVFIVCGVDRPVTEGRIQRAVTQSWEANATPVIVLTKVDMAEDIDAQLEILANAVPTTEVLQVSSTLGSGVDELRKMTIDKSAVMIGESGAGKSTLLNALLGEDIGATGEVRGADSRGRHTTVRRELHLIPDGGVLIDTPGVRSLGLWADSDSVDTTFDDVAEVADQCRFSDCAHGSEPGCAIDAAIEDGTLAADRVDQWRDQRREVEALELRRDLAARRKADRKFSRVVGDAIEAKRGRKR